MYVCVLGIATSVPHDQGQTALCFDSLCTGCEVGDTWTGRIDANNVPPLCLAYEHLTVLDWTACACLSMQGLVCVLEPSTYHTPVLSNAHCRGIAALAPIPVCDFSLV